MKTYTCVNVYVNLHRYGKRNGKEVVQAVNTGFIKALKIKVVVGRSWKKQESSRKTSISAVLTMPKPLTVWITINCGKF